MSPSVAVLFARRDSVYYGFPECDVYDADRDARTFRGGLPVIAHPPCRAWGRLRHMARPAPGEKDLARFAVSAVRSCGGVLEHPAFSSLWRECALPWPGDVDEFGGWTLPIHQQAFGHRAQKATFLYIVGVAAADVPKMPLVLGLATHVIGANTRTAKEYKRPEVSRPEREATPAALAGWLINLAGRSSVGIAGAGLEKPALLTAGFSSMGGTFGA